MNDAALEYVARGWSVFPLAPGTKKPMKGSNGFEDATTDPDKIRAWWEKNPSANIGIRTGPASNLVVLDFDVKDGQPGHEAYKNLKHQGHDLNTLMSRTPSGGIHLLFKYNGDDIRNNASTLLAGMDNRRHIRCLGWWISQCEHHAP
jgi:hypothetical protein